MLLDQITFHQRPSPRDLAHQLWVWGGACLPGFVKPADLETMTQEMSAALALEPRLNCKRDCANGTAAIVPREVLENDKQAFQMLASFLNDAYLVEIGRLFFGLAEAQAHQINNQLELEVNTQTGPSVGSRPHVDRVPALKMILYLTDVTRDSGATFFYPGSQIEMRRQIRQQLRQDPNPLNLRNFVPQASLPPPPYIEAPAGTLIIVDTFAIHGGGELKEHGSTRKTMRATTWARPLVGAYFEDRAPEAAELRMPLPTLNLYHPCSLSDATLPDDLMYRET